MSKVDFLSNRQALDFDPVTSFAVGAKIGRNEVSKVGSIFASCIKERHRISMDTYKTQLCYQILGQDFYDALSNPIFTEDYQTQWFIGFILDEKMEVQYTTASLDMKNGLSINCNSLLSGTWSEDTIVIFRKRKSLWQRLGL